MEKYPISNFRTVEVMQEVERGFTLQLVNDIVAEWSSLKDYAYILHDKDETRPHIHLMMRFNCSVPTSAILKKFGGVVEFQHLQKCHSWKSAMAYLTHSNRPDKFQYDDADVFSNFDWKKDADDAKKKVTLDDVLTLVREKILSGFSPYDVYSMLDDLDGNVYAKYKNKIEAQIKQSTLIFEKNNGVGRNMKVLFFYGGAGTGKTTMAKDFATSRNYSFYISSCGKYMFDDYQGQDVIILDDLRDSTMHFSEFLKVLDNHTGSNVSCRYNNKSIRWCKYIIITTTKTPDEFYNGVTESRNEEKKQILRRFSEVWHFNPDKIAVSTWDSEREMHIYQCSVNNPVAFYRKTQAEKEQIKNDLLSGFELMSKALGFDFGVSVPKNINDIPDDELPI